VAAGAGDDVAAGVLVAAGIIGEGDGSRVAAVAGGAVAGGVVANVDAKGPASGLAGGVMLAPPAARANVTTATNNATGKPALGDLVILRSVI
jgi:hypothetical protein